MYQTLRRHGRAMVDGLSKFNGDDGWAIASHITLAGIMALFPFLIFCASLVAFFDLGNFPQTAVDLVFEFWPPSVAETLSNEILNVLTKPRGDVLTFGALIALFFASSGIEALRLGLNRAYRMTETRNLLVRRAQSILFVLLASVVMAVVAFLLVLLPVAQSAVVANYAPWLEDYLIDIGGWRLVISAVVILAGLFASHKWLPSNKVRFAALTPGIVLTIVLWVAASFGFATYLGTFANYGGTYAGLAGIVITLVFVYIMSAIFLMGAEYNAALMATDKIEGK